MELRDETVMAVLAELDHIDEEERRGRRAKNPPPIRGEAVRLRAQILDDVLRTMTAPQRELLKRWRGFVCPKCDHTMVANLPQDRADQ